MFGIPIEKVDRNKERKIAKTINFGLAYGQGAKSLGIRIGMDKEEAEKMIEKYFSQFSNIRNWLNSAAKSAKQNAHSKTILGRKRYYRIPDNHTPDYTNLLSSIERKGKNSPIQGSAVDMIKIALILIWQRLREANLDASLINTVHDEIVVECAADIAKKAGQIVEDSMIEAGESLVPNVPIKADINIGNYWNH